MGVGNANLIVQEGPDQGKEIPLLMPKAIVGREEAADITFNSPEMSRQHAQFLRQGEQYQVEDLGSTNGTFVNGNRISGRTALNDGDIIDLGDAVRLVFRYDIADEFPTMAEMGGPLETLIEPLPQSSSGIHDPREPKDISGTAVFASPLPESETTRRRWFLGCGCGFLLLIFLCAALLFFLDSYQQGQLLYCGTLRPLFETVLGPFGFNPLCG